MLKKVLLADFFSNIFSKYSYLTHFAHILTSDPSVFLFVPPLLIFFPISWTNYSSFNSDISFSYFKISIFHFDFIVLLWHTTFVSVPLSLDQSLDIESHPLSCHGSASHLLLMWWGTNMGIFIYPCLWPISKIWISKKKGISLCLERSTANNKWPTKKTLRIIREAFDTHDRLSVWVSLRQLHFLLSLYTWASNYLVQVTKVQQRVLSTQMFISSQFFT